MVFPADDDSFGLFASKSKALNDLTEDTLLRSKTTDCNACFDVYSLSLGPLIRKTYRRLPLVT